MGGYKNMGEYGTIIRDDSKKHLGNEEENDKNVRDFEGECTFIIFKYDVYFH